MWTLLFIIYFIQWSSCLVAAYNLKRKKPKIDFSPSFTIIRPFSNLDHNAVTNICSAHNLSYTGKVKFIYCLENDKDPTLKLIEEVIPNSLKYDTSIMIGQDNYKNPKLANVAKGVAQIDTEFTAMIDSNVVLYIDYLQTAINTYYKNYKVGLVSAPPLAVDAQNFWSEMEASTLNNFQLRWQYATDFFNFAYAQGKNLVYRTEMLRMVGGLKALDHIAEDASFTKEIRKLGLRVALMPPTRMFLGKRSLRDFWGRQVRWARYRRKTFLLEFLPEIFTGITPALLILLFNHVAIMPFVGMILLFYIPEFILSLFLNVSIPSLFIFHSLLRDLMLNVVWFMAWGNSINWQNKKLDLSNL